MVEAGFRPANSKIYALKHFTVFLPPKPKDNNNM